MCWVGKVPPLAKEMFYREMTQWLSVMGIRYFREVTEWLDGSQVEAEGISWKLDAFAHGALKFPLSTRKNAQLLWHLHSPRHPPPANAGSHFYTILDNIQKAL